MGTPAPPLAQTSRWRPRSRLTAPVAARRPNRNEFYARDDPLEVFHRKYGPPNISDGGPRWRLRFGHFARDDVYETTVASLVTPETAWLDVGCGRDLFQFNRATARLLAARRRFLAGVDPSENIHQNELVHERFRGPIPEFPVGRQFDLVTLRMVAEHITDPGQTAAVLSRVCVPGGRVVIHTVFKWPPGTIVSAP